MVWFSAITTVHFLAAFSAYWTVQSKEYGPVRKMGQLQNLDFPGISTTLKTILFLMLHNINFGIDFLAVFHIQNPLIKHILCHDRNAGNIYIGNFTGSVSAAKNLKMSVFLRAVHKHKFCAHVITPVIVMGAAIIRVQHTLAIRLLCS